MLIQAEVFRALAEAHPEGKFKVDAQYFRSYGKRTSARDFQFDFFQMGVEQETREYLSEDWFFCEQAGALGFKTFLLPSTRTFHTGSLHYTMNMPAIASLDSVPAKGAI